jgi:amidase
MQELDHLDGTALAALVEKREVQPIELVDRAIRRAEAINGALNAIVTPMFELARDVARQPLPKGPFTGVPFALKDLVAAFAGVRMTRGSRALASFVPDHDSELVIRFKRAGLIPIGKTNTPELGLLPTTESRLFGAAKNPWNPGYTTGGSSGGSAAAVSARIVPLAHGNDGGGSIRIPASCCGLFGLKPTRGRVPLGPELGELLNGLVVEHALTRSVRDSARLLDAIHGPDVGPPYVAPAPARPYREELEHEPRRLKIAFSPDPRLDPECRAAVDDAAKLCAELGHELIEDRPVLPGEELSRAFFEVWVAGVALHLATIGELRKSPVTEDEVELLTWNAAELGRGISALQQTRAVRLFHRAGRLLGQFFERYDVWLTSTLAAPPLPLGSFAEDRSMPLSPLIQAAEWAPFTAIANITGVPAMSVPLYWSTAGLPIGVQFIAPFGDESTLFSLAGQLERARPWADRRPPL